MIPTVGTYQVINSTEAFNPTVGQVTFSSGTPFEDSNEDDVHQDCPQPLPHRFTEWLDVASLANIAKVHCETDDSGNSTWKANGDPTEIAIQVLRTAWTGRDLSGPRVNLPSLLTLLNIPLILPSSV